MSKTISITQKQWLISTALFGGVLWSITFLSYQNSSYTDSLHEVKLLLFFGAAVIIPLALRLGGQPSRNGTLSATYRLAVLVHPLVIIAVGRSLWGIPGPFAALFPFVWLVQTGLIALYGLKRMLARPCLAIEELCIDAGLLYLLISGLWFATIYLDFRLLPFDQFTAMLTAVHFTYISLGALVMCGMIGRRLYNTPGWKFYRPIAWLMLVSPLAVAIGITITQFTGHIAIEALSVFMLTGTLILLMLLHISRRFSMRSVGNILIMVSSIAVIITMILALVYVVGRLTDWWSLSIREMVSWHGWLNAFGFVFLGLLGWNISTPKSPVSLPGFPFSQLPWRWHIGSDFFTRVAAIDPGDQSPPTGIVDKLSEYRRDDFDPEMLSPVVTAFYEHTENQELRVYPEWKAGFLWLARLYKVFSRRVEQMNFPLYPETQETRISSQIVPLQDRLDGRTGVRGWVRTYDDLGQAVYVAAYASHCHLEETYMNIAFPLPFGNLTSILRLETLEECLKGVRLTSYSTRQGDQGVYFANRFAPIRLPINEIIDVYPADAAYAGCPLDYSGAEVVARHRMWLFGLQFLTLHYSITLRQDV